MGSLKWTHQKPHKTNMMVIHMTTGDESKLNNKFVYTNIKNFWKYNPNFQPKVIDGYRYFSHTHIVLLQKTDSSTLVVWITIMLTCHVFRSVNFRDLLHLHYMDYTDNFSKNLCLCSCEEMIFYSIILMFLQTSTSTV